jgi:tripartite-type tricarboxylate transporter receptor subunit TctC
MRDNDRRHFCAGLGVLMATTCLPARAQSGRTGRVVIGFTAGNPFDSLARVLAERLRMLLDAPMIVDNRPGASGAIAAEFIRQAPPDGSVVWLSPFGTMITEPIVNKGVVRFDPQRDFTAVSRLATFDIALAVGPGAPARTLAEYMSMVKADPSKGSFGTPGANNLPHFFTLLVGKAAQTDLINVPFKSAGDAMTAALGGQIGAVASGFGDLVEMHRAGKLRILATSGATRSPFMPDLPTFRESGFDVVGQGWFGIYLPPAAPREVVARINRAVAEALKTREMVDFMRNGGLNPAPTTPEAFAEIMRQDIVFWSEAIRSSGVKLGA